MSSEFNTEDHFIIQLTSKIKTYILSVKPMIIESKAFVKHIYYYAFYEYIHKHQYKFNINKTNMLADIEKAFLIAISQISLYKTDGERYILCEN